MPKSPKAAFWTAGILWLLAAASFSFSLEHIFDGPNFGWESTSFSWARDGAMCFSLASFGAGVVYILFGVYRLHKKKLLK